MQDLSRHAGKFYGKYAGTVVRYANTLPGALIVKVPAVFGPDLEVEARPSFPYGHFYVPPDDEHVWVEFEGGWTDHPIWVGVWYPDGAEPQEAQEGAPANRVVRTVSGHTLELDDTEGTTRITLRHTSGSVLTIDDAGTVVLANKNGASLHLNTANQEASFTSEQGHTVSMGPSGMVLANDQGAALDLTGNAVRITAGTILLEATSVALGASAGNAGQPLILGNTFKALWDLFQAHTHPSAMGPTGMPLPLVQLPPPTFTSAVKAL